MNPEEKGYQQTKIVIGTIASGIIIIELAILILLAL